jgi:hypothetical protein
MGRYDESGWQNSLGIAAVIVAAGLAIWLVCVGIGGGWGLARDIPNRGLEAVLGAGSWSYAATCWALALATWAVVGLLVVAVAASAGWGVKKTAEVVKAKPVFTLALALGWVAALLADLCKDYLPGASPLEKDVFKFSSLALFAVAAWLYERPRKGYKAAAFALWVVFPLVTLAQVLSNTAGGKVDPNSPAVRLNASLFVGGWFVLVVVIVLAAWGLRKKLAEEDGEEA